MKMDVAPALLVAVLLWAPALLAQGTPRSAFGAEALGGLVGALQATPGCLGVDTARTTSGKQVIFAWFEDKKAALRWYHSEPHTNVMRLTGIPASAEPMSGVPDDGQPILVIASVTLAPPASDGASASPAMTQVAVELYSPLPGGIAVGGRFAPAAVKVPGLRVAPMARPPRGE